MWRIAKSIWDDLRTFDSKMHRALGFGLDKRPQPGGVGVQQTMCITRECFGPFLKPKLILQFIIIPFFSRSGHSLYSAVDGTRRQKQARIQVKITRSAKYHLG